MTSHHKSEILIARDEIVAAPGRASNDQTFELPTGLYVAMALMFAGFISVLAFAFHGGMGVSFGVIFAFLAVFFVIPAIFPHMKPDGRVKPLSWAIFQERGIRTATGRASATDATILVLLLPFLIFCFAVAIATIAALV